MVYCVSVNDLNCRKPLLLDQLVSEESSPVPEVDLSILQKETKTSRIIGHKYTSSLLQLATERYSFSFEDHEWTLSDPKTTRLSRPRSLHQTGHDDREPPYKKSVRCYTV